MVKGCIYLYDKIEVYSKKNGFEMMEFGNEVIGEHIITLKKNEGYGIVITFVMVALTQYECVYTDVN